MKTKYIIGLLFIFISSLAIAQNHTIPRYSVKGYVNYHRKSVDPTSIYVTVYGNNKLFQTNIDSNGYFYLENIDSGYYHVIISSNDGAKTFSHVIIDHEGTEIHLNLPKLPYYCVVQSYSKGKVINYPPIQKAPNQQIEALAAYSIIVDYRYSNTINFGNSNEIIIGKQ
ncbi:MAG: hypothetical protein V4538_04615 [Bacteroidota bacterium]